MMKLARFVFVGVLPLTLTACELRSTDLSQGLLVVFAALALMFVLLWASKLRRMRRDGEAWHWPRPIEIAIGVIAD